MVTKSGIKVSFRVDGSDIIGSGHVVRCLTFADILKTKNIDSHFICRDHPGNMISRIESSGYNVSVLNTGKSDINSFYSDDSVKHSSWLGVSWEQDALDTAEVLKDIDCNFLVIDHMGIDEKWEKKIFDLVEIRMMTIDGLADRKHFVNILLDQTYSPEGVARWKELVPEKCKIFAGPQFAIIRPEFYEFRKKYLKRDGIIKRINVSFGGVDPVNATSYILEKLETVASEDMIVDVIIGGANPHIKMILDRFTGMKNVFLHIDPKNIWELMSQADIAIGAGGTMMWERCCLGLPTIIITIADNQVKMSEHLHSIGAAYYLGSLDYIQVHDILENKLKWFMEHPSEQQKISVKAFDIMGDLQKKPHDNIIKEITNPDN